MREDEFEKQVREKMGQLGFDPSESVWVNVDKEINKEKKRRVPLFWLFFLSGLLVAGGAYYFITNKNSLVNPEKLPEQAESSKRQNKEQAIQSVMPQKNDQGTQENEAIEPSGTAHYSKHMANPSLMNQKQVHQIGTKGIVKKETDRKDGIIKEKNELRENSVIVGTGAIVMNDNNNNKSVKTESGNENKSLSDSALAKTETSAIQNKSKKDSATSLAIAKNNEQKKKHSAWKIGYTLNAGFSNLNQDLLNSVKTYPPTTSLANTPTRNISSGTVTYSSSPIQAGFSFAAGAFATKELSKRFSFSGGISYHYYSTKIKTGTKIDNGLYAYNNGVITSSSYYENGNTQMFTNQYHFIEIPLLVNIKLNKGNKPGFSWEAGLSPGYLLGSKALYYNSNANIYTTNYLQPNKMQLNGATALMIGFPFYKGDLQLGPQVQYGFTGFVNTNDGNPGHLFYAGLKISFIPGKK